MRKIILCLLVCGYGAVQSKGDVMPEYLYKIISVEQWNQSKSEKQVALDSIDKDFIHFSTDQQLDRTIEKFWSNQPYVVLKVETDQLLGELKFETNPGGTNKYYHLYNGSIPIEAVEKISK